MLAKVVRCSRIPPAYMYPTENFYCEHMNEDGTKTSLDEGYEAWRHLHSIWPPTRPCEDDVEKLNSLLKFLWLPLRIPPWELPVKNCSDAKSKLEAAVPNWGCDTPNRPGMNFRDMCCSVCGAQPMQVLPPAPAPLPPQSSYKCTVCQHVYDPVRDGVGKAFEDLPDTWVCPQCGAKKSAYKKTLDGDWIHE